MLIIIAVLLIIVLGLLYVAPNFFGIGGNDVDTVATMGVKNLKTVVALSLPSWQMI